jgi:hypothetical protein
MAPCRTWPSSTNLSSYGVLALPTAFTFTAVQFSLGALKRGAIVSYLGSVLFFVTVSIEAGLAINVLQMPTVGKLLDPTCRITALNLMSDTLTPLQANTVLIGLEGSILANRLLWIGVAFGLLSQHKQHSRFHSEITATRVVPRLGGLARDVFTVTTGMVSTRFVSTTRRKSPRQICQNECSLQEERDLSEPM